VKKILIFGNSGSGKSTLAAKLSASDNLAHLDLDTLAWKPTTPPERESLDISRVKIEDFISKNSNWVVEGCYSDLLEIVCSELTEIIFLNLPVELCIENARNRPWEPHKYNSKEAQDKNLNMLINWLSEYTNRNDEFSFTSHINFYDAFLGKKSMIKHNAKNTFQRHEMNS
jgi:adenylate kinase family enzyme